MQPLAVRSAIIAALGGLLFGFDTAVISGTTKDLTQVFDLSGFRLGFTVATALIGTIVGAAYADCSNRRTPKVANRLSADADEARFQRAEIQEALRADEDMPKVARGQSWGALTHWTFAAAISWSFPAIAGTLGGGVAFGFFFFCGILMTFWVIKVMPETKGVPLEEMEATLGLQKSAP